MKNATEMKIQNSDAFGVGTLSVTETDVDTSKCCQITVLTSNAPKLLTKEIRLAKEGRLVRVPSAQLTRGETEVVSITRMEEFSELLTDLADNQALVYGIPKHGLTQARVVTKKALESLQQSSNVIARSNDHFEWSASPGVMMLD